MDTKVLRQKILDLAIQGKLVLQEPGDEPASALLERIRVEKQQMVKDGKLKAKDIKNDTIIFRGEDNLHYEKFQDGTVKCIEDEIPFEVPEGWAWCRLNAICSILTDGTHKTPLYSDKGYTFLSSKSVTEGVINWNNTMYIPENLHEELYARLAPQLNDILLAKNGTTGVAAIVDRECLFDIYVSLALIRIVKGIISPQYILNAIGSTYIQGYFNSSLKGIGVPNLHLEHIRNTLIPIPPYLEEMRIVEKINRIIPLCNQIQQNKDVISSTIVIAKTKVLNLAIRGKLVPQDPNDEPASVLIERIRAEKEYLVKQGKIRRDKKDSIIFKGDDNSYYEKTDDTVLCIDDEIPFEIPNSWTYVRLKHIGQIVGGGTPKTNIDEYWDGEIPWLTPADLSGYEDIYISRGARMLTEIGLKSSSAQILPQNTVLYSSRAPIGYTAIASNPVATNQGFKSVVPYEFEMSPYLYYCLKARTEDIVQRATGTTFKEISGSEISKTIIPLPPLREQKRIFKKVTLIFDVISTIEKSLN